MNPAVMAKMVSYRRRDVNEGGEQDGRSGGMWKRVKRECLREFRVCVYVCVCTRKREIYMVHMYVCMCVCMCVCVCVQEE
jgi:hypothetical protein